MSRLARALAASGAVACAASVGLGAYASHGLADADARRAGLAALFLFGHGLALFMLATPSAGRLRLAALAALALGVVLFSGSLLGAVFLATPTALAPAGGVLMMLAWLTLAADALRPRG
ncbi:MAG TPA: DUF423 domain-containing protein [Arenimonas sp.]|uniref:DUF423 domain-containing protein n=1 Tax=Arenimonas sp. TaxID=1872635 RepID=UPI002D7FFB48|nr:DUF423 domain-containing protein [Arenimonas sp.]HEU0151827.1 DUF423 domain-containing protein [Arenimonas sp.]